jgi:ferredoxin
MIRITFIRRSCIGCNACVEAAPYRWAMSKKDGKCVLLEAKEKNGFYNLSVSDEEWEDNLAAARNCPVNVIKLGKS